MMDKRISSILKQAISFFCISGIGWIFDFTTYLVLTNVFDCKVMYANMLSAIPAFTYVFSVSRKKIFKNKDSKISMKCKYLIYFVYQILLVASVSVFGEMLYHIFMDIISFDFIINHLKVFIKLLITPVTMILNFIIMKNLIEKL